MARSEPVWPGMAARSGQEQPNIAQWLERLTADQQVPGSNPGVPFFSAGQFSNTEPRDFWDQCSNRPYLNGDVWICVLP